MSQSSHSRILISGAGIAGPICAYWLRRSHPQAEITIIERAPEIRKEGQTVDVVTEGRTVFDSMGITERVMESTTKEKGLDFVDSKGGVWGHFPQDNSGAGSFTREIEIVRGKLAAILYEEIKDMVIWRFDDSITSIEQDRDGVDVTFKQGGNGRYDILIIADGLSSRTRAMAFNQDVRDPIKSLHQYVAGFSLPALKGESQYAKWYNTSQSRVILHRPDGFGLMRTNFIHIDKTTTTRDICSSKTPIAQQKEYFADLFQRAGWESERIIKGMMDSTDFYTYEVGQVKMDRWSKGRIVLVGDAASCPSPISGAGTNVAITQAYTLAAMITKYRGDHEKAFKAYEEDLRGWVEGIQKLPPGVPGLACPKSNWGVRVLLVVTWIGGFIVRSGIIGVLGRWFGGEEKGHRLPPVEVFDSGRS
jgi:2-polyprenyl-6-methoxyphenol hydroxylase-like FAD-dependent oxidoreductase